MNNVNRVAWSPCSKIIIILKMWNCFSSTCCKYLQDLIQWSWSLERSFSFSKVQMETIFNKHLRQLLFSLTWMNQNNDRGNSENIFTCLMQLSIWSEANRLSIHQHNNNKKLCKIHNNHTFLEFPIIHHFHKFPPRTCFHCLQILISRSYLPYKSRKCKFYSELSFLSLFDMLMVLARGPWTT